MITRLTFNEALVTAFGDASFGNVGSLEEIQGRAFGELDQPIRWTSSSRI
jgi:hypothetical protein